MSYLKIKRSLLVTLGVTAVAAAGVLVGCSGGDTDGDGNEGAGPTDGYVSDGGAGATLTIRLADGGNELNVADVEGFFVEALDPRGVPLSFIRIFCESERGIAIIEPSANGVAFEHTGPDGLMSGRLGGLLPGSFMLECRAPEGFGLVARTRLHVRGSVPANFAGFPGAAGGNLGGGVIINDTNAGAASLLEVTFSDAGGESPSGPFDILPQNPNCDADPTTVDPEPFTDVNYALTINNTFNQPITVTSVQFQVGGGVNANSGELGVVATIPAGSSGTVSGLFVTFNGALTQVFNGTNVAVTAGTYPVTITVRGETASGEEVEITDTVSVTFRLVDNC